jgi:deoxyribonucleoside regulator
VSRLLTQAEEAGIVHIIIDEFENNALNLEQELKERFGLKEAVVVYQMGLSEDAIRKNIGDAAAKFLQKIVVDGDCIGVTSGQTLWETSYFLQKTNARDLKIIQLMGGAGAIANNIYPEELVRNFANKLHVTAFSLHAPLFLENREVRNAILATAPNLEVTRMWNALSVVMMGIGNVSMNSFLFKTGWFNREVLDRMTQMGAVAVICGQFIDVNGNHIWAPTDEQCIAANPELFRFVNKSIVVAAGKDKAEPMLAAIKGKYCNIVITDDKTAQEILAIK